LAHGAYPAWRRLGWQRRVALLRRAAELLSERRLALAALMAWEVGKNRIEAAAEVEESADLLRYYCDLMERHDGYRQPMARIAPDEATESVCLPYGVWGVVSPFNFPSALAAGMVAGALVTGNTVVLKPSQDAPLSGAHLCRALWDAGVPRDALHLVMGGGEEVGAAILGHPLTAGLAFTGSWEVGMRIQRTFSRAWPKPVVVEMGGKNPTVVTATADLAAAAAAVARAAFGFGGQKCSACSRAYVERTVAGEFIERLLAATAGLTVGNPLRQEVFLGPLIHARAVDSFTGYVAGVRAAGGEILAGGNVLSDGDLAHGHYVEPTVATLPDPSHPYFTEEMFVPLLLVHPVADLDEALALCNRAPYGLTAGLFSRDPAEVERFLDGIEAGVTYINRKSGSTTGAWPGVNPFGGWKASGGTGPAALGPNYLLKFLREQSRTVNEVGVG
ncbi:MAG: aldehyde dehydrogenase family protein, partial [Candidatus Acidiferrales bacterium]